MPHKTAEARRAYYLLTREKQLADRKVRYEKNKEYVLKQNKAWSDANKEHHQQLNRDWAKKNKGAHALHSKKYTQRKRGNNFIHTELDKFIEQEMYAMAQLRTEQLGKEWHVDHTIPLSKGGPHAIHNLEVVPAAWNTSKGNRHSNRFREIKS